MKETYVITFASHTVQVRCQIVLLPGRGDIRVSDEYSIQSEARNCKFVIFYKTRRCCADKYKNNLSEPRVVLFA